MTNSERLSVENKIYKTFDLLDPSKRNSQKYKNKFKDMTDAEFEKFMKKFLKDDNMNFCIEIIPYELKLDMENIKKAAQFLKVPLFEYVAQPSADPDGEPLLTEQPVLVGYCHMKRVQQMVVKKNKQSIYINQRNPKTGQVTGKDKAGMSSDVENISLIAIDTPLTIKELLGAKSDDMEMKTEMLRKIQEDGYFSLSDLTSRKSNKIALNTLDVQFIAAGIKTNLVTEGLLLVDTLKNQDKDISTLSYSKTT